MCKKLFKTLFVLGLLALGGLVAIQFDGPRQFVKDLGVDL